MKKILVLILCLAAAIQLHAQDTNKPTVRLGGTIFLMTYYDTYESVDNREGVSYSYPKAPSLDANGRDINKSGQFGMSAYPTRLFVTADQFRLLEADARAYIEADFMGANGSSFKMLRLRHAYFDLRWAKDELLFGQTSNLLMPDEVISGLLTAGAGSPISVLERPIMFRYGRRLSDHWKAYVAMSYHHVQAGDAGNDETFDAARNNGYPSGEARLQYTSDRFFFGVGGSYKSLKPRLSTDAGLKTDERIGSAQATAFLRLLTKCGHTLKFQAVYGSNLSNLGMPGGYGKALSSSEDDYSYTNFEGISTWIDFDSKSYNHFHFGLYVGYLENLGSVKEIDPSVIYARNADLHYTGRIGPRITWMKDRLYFGLEYSLFWSKWGQTFDEHYLPVDSHKTTRNNRISIQARYTF